jgi:hypothetical protein
MTSKDSRRRGAKKTSKRFELAWGPEAHPLLRVAGCVPRPALAWLFLQPGGAALATVIVVLSFALRRSLAMCGLCSCPSHGRHDHRAVSLVGMRSLGDPQRPVRPTVDGDP